MPDGGNVRPLFQKQRDTTKTPGGIGPDNIEITLFVRATPVSPRSGISVLHNFLRLAFNASMPIRSSLLVSSCPSTSIKSKFFRRSSLILRYYPKHRINNFFSTIAAVTYLRKRGQCNNARCFQPKKELGCGKLPRDGAIPFSIVSHFSGI